MTRKQGFNWTSALGVAVLVVAVLGALGAVVGLRNHAEPALAAQPSPKPKPGIGVPVGILPVANAPMPAQEFTMTNAWQGYDDQGNLVQVWAGASAEDSSQGEVVVHVLRFEDDGSGTSVSGGVLPTPTKQGAVTISAAKGSVLSLTANDGAIWSFDVGANTFSAGP
jgi:hypothetical protein